MPLAAYLRSLDPRLPRSVWTLQAGWLVSWIGSGIVTPFVLIYLHNVRGFSLGTAGLIAGTQFAVAPLSGLLAGAVTDRAGARATAAGSLLLLAAGHAAFPLVREPWHGFVLMAVIGVGQGALGPSQASLLTGLTPEPRRHAAWSVQRVGANVGFAAGGAAGGLIASSAEPATYTVLFLLDAVSFLVFMATLAFIPSVRGAAAADGARLGRYRDVGRDRVFLGTVAIGALFVVGGYSAVNSLLPVFAKTEAGVSEKGIGLIFFVNGLTIVVAQLPITRAIEGRRRMRVLALLGVVWAGAWLAALGVGLWLSAVAAAVLLTLVAVVSGLSECLHGAVQGPLISDLAPARLRGRYMAVYLVANQLSFAAGTALGGILLALSAPAFWALAAAVCLAGGAAALALERGLPRAAVRTPEPQPLSLAAAEV